jgi:zinc/manganese transport system substrate-binding protein
VKKVAVLILVCVLLITIVGCVSETNSPNNKKSIVVTYSILGSVVKDLAADQADVRVLIPNGLDPHE